MYEVPFMTNITQEQERRIALLGLLVTESKKVGACPVDELLATFIEGRLTGKVRQVMLAHLNHCPSCYYSVVGSRCLS
jgi:Putative zinc-finger